MSIWLSDDMELVSLTLKSGLGMKLTPDLKTQLIKQLHVIRSGITYSLKVSSQIVLWS